MKHQLLRLIVLTAALVCGAPSLLAQASAFTYQGRLNDASGPANGVYDLVFTLQGAASGAAPVGVPVAANGTVVSNGLFTVTLDFGAPALDGGVRWLEIAVKTNGAPGFATLAPRQALTSTPYAVRAAHASAYSGTVGAGQITGTLAPTLIGAGSITGDKLASGAVISALAASNVNFQAGNAVIGAGNVVSNGVVRSTIAGGGITGFPNSIGSDSSFIGAGNVNRIGNGFNNAFIGAGFANTILGYGGFIGAGNNNRIDFNAFQGVIAGGDVNQIAPGVSFGTIPGGQANLVGGSYGFAAGRRARANHPGAFVWADSTDADFGSTGTNQFLVRATGGVGINKTNPATALDVSGTVTATGFSGNGSGLTGVTAAAFTGPVGDGQLSANVVRRDQANTFSANQTVQGSLAVAGPISGTGFAGDGAGLGGLWKLGGNAGTTPGTHFLGTTDNQPLEFKVNGNRGLRLQPAENGSVHVIGGYSGNFVSGALGATIAGGGGEGRINQVTNSFGTVGGGEENTAGFRATVAGGERNTASGNNSMVPGGYRNTAAGEVSFAAGNRAKANHNGAFVWADNVLSDFASTADNQFLIRASGGVGIGTNATAGSALRIVPVGTDGGLKVDLPNASNVSRGIEVSQAGVGAGVYATSAGGNAVWGIAHSKSSAGVVGDNDVGGEAVVGRSTGNFNGTGIGAVVGVNDLTNGYGVRGFATKAGGIGVLGQAGTSSANNIAGRFENLNATGTNPVLQVMTPTGASGRLVSFVQGGAEVASVAANGMITAPGFVGDGSGLTGIAKVGGNNSFTGDQSITGGLYVDTAGVNNGVIFGAGSPGLVFGGTGSGEGIASKRTAGGNQFGLDFYTGYTPRLSIQGNGSVGIGTISASDRLHVVGQSVRARVEGTDSSFAGFLAKNTAGEWFTGVGGAGGEWTLFQNSPSSASRLVVTTSGNVGIGRTSTANRLEVEGNASKTTASGWAANSDRRIKQDIQTVDSALDTLNRVRLVSFRYTDDYRAAHPSLTDRPYLNVIAQEFAEVFPEHVQSSGEKLPDGSEILQVDTYPLTIYSAAAVQELSRKVEEKDAKIAALEARLEKLERLMEAKGGAR